MKFSETWSELDCREVEVLSQLLDVLSRGVVKPNDPTHLIRKMQTLEKELDTDLSEIINCCPPSNVVFEAKEYHSLRHKVLERIESKF